MFSRILLSAAMAVVLQGCAKVYDVKQLEGKTSAEMYQCALKAIEEKKYKDAIAIFNELEKQYPYSENIDDVIVKRADCKYDSKQVNEAIVDYETFIKTNISSKLMPYVLYRLTVIYFNMIPIIERDQTDAIKAQQYGHALLENYPGTEFEEEVKQILVSVDDFCAAKELYIAKSYQKRKNYVAALRRLEVVVRAFEKTVVMPEVLYRMIECNIALNAKEDAKNVNRVLQDKYKDSDWAKYAEALLQKYKI